MAATTNEILLDHAIGHAIDLTKHSNHVVRRMIALLNRADPDLVAQIAAALERLPAGSFTVSHLEQVLGSVRAINTAAYAQVFNTLPTEMRDLAAYEVGYQGDLLAHAIPAPVLAQVSLAKVSADQVYAAALSRPFQGNLLSRWAAGVEADRMTNIRDAIRVGFVQGQTVDQIVRRIRGTRAANYADGILERPRKALTAVVRTALSHTAKTAREEVYKANADLIKAIEWVATLDSRTSEMCRIRDGKQYAADANHRPIGHSIPWGAGPGALHWNCRSVSTPVLKSYKDLGLDIAELPPGTRAAMGGQVPAGTTYAEWFKKQSAARQDEIVGPTRGRLMRQGGLPFASMYTSRGDFLNLDQLRERDAQVFKRAGL